MTFITTWAVAAFSFLSILRANVTFVDMNEKGGFDNIYGAGKCE